MSVADKIKRLKGQRVAMPSANGSGEKMLGVLAKKYGLTLPGDISSVYLGAEAPSYVAAFQKDLIDAALPFEPAGVLVQQSGKGKIYLNMMNGEIPEFRDILFMTLATHPDVMKERPEMLRKVAQVFTEAQKILKDDPKRGMAIMAKEYPSMTPETNAEAYKTVSQIWTRDGHMTEAQARGTFAYLQPKGVAEVDFPSTFTNEFLPKKYESGDASVQRRRCHHHAGRGNQSSELSAPGYLSGFYRRAYGRAQIVAGAAPLRG